jgi:hypothetical protein
VHADRGVGGEYTPGETDSLLRRRHGRLERGGNLQPKNAAWSTA